MHLVLSTLGTIAFTLALLPTAYALCWTADRALDLIKL